MTLAGALRELRRAPSDRRKHRSRRPGAMKQSTIATATRRGRPELLPSDVAILATVGIWTATTTVSGASAADG